MTVDDQLDVSEGSGILNMKVLFGSTAETGRLFLTNQRILFLSQPDPLLAAKYDAYPLGMADATSKALKAHALRKQDAHEFCEISLDEIEGFWVKKRTYGVLFLSTFGSGTRKGIMYRRSSTDDKFAVLKSLLTGRLQVTEPEDRRGSFLLGKRFPFLGKRR